MGFWKTFFGGEQSCSEDEKLKENAKNFDLLKYDGVKALRTGQLDYSVMCFRKALTIKEDLEVRDYLSQALIHQNKLEDAFSELKAISNSAPDNVHVLLQAAHVAYMLEDYDEMQTLCDKALEVDDKNELAYYRLAQARQGHSDYIGAIALLTKSLNINEQMFDARLLRAKLLLHMGDVESANKDSEWLLTNNSDEEDVLLLAARLAHVQDNDDKALNIYNKVLDLNPFLLEAYRERGAIKYSQGDINGAEFDMHKILELNPDEVADINGDYSAEGIEQAVKRSYSNLNPFGI